MCFLQRYIYFRTAVASSSVTMVGATPYKLFLKVPWVHKQLASYDFTFRKRLVQNMANNQLGEHLDAFFHSQLSKIEAAMAFWATDWQKTSSVQT